MHLLQRSLFLFMDDVKKPLCTTNAFELPQRICNVTEKLRFLSSAAPFMLFLPRPELNYEVFKYHLGLRKHWRRSTVDAGALEEEKVVKQLKQWAVIIRRVISPGRDSPSLCPYRQACWTIKMPSLCPAYWKGQFAFAIVVSAVLTAVLVERKGRGCTDRLPLD